MRTKKVPVIMKFKKKDGSVLKFNAKKVVEVKPNKTRKQVCKECMFHKGRIATLKEVLKEAQTFRKTSRKFMYFIHRIEAKLKEVENK